MLNFHFCVAVLGLLLCPIAARASVITYSDGTFAPSSWTFTTDIIIGSSASATQQTSGGNPGYCRQVKINVAAGNFAQVYAFNMMAAATLTPATQGAISLLTYGEDRNAPTDQEFGPAVYQGGIYYYANAGYYPTNGWSTLPPTAFASTSFVTPTSSTSHPDFTSAGAPLEFGFVAINNNGEDGSAFSTTTEYDNFQISLTTVAVPEPASVGGLLAMGYLFCRRRPAAV
jgi:hypothetical protein